MKDYDPLPGPDCKGARVIMVKVNHLFLPLRPACCQRPTKRVPSDFYVSSFVFDDPNCERMK